ncbi:MAG: hypothetical protein KJ666_17995 [Bacteroidetes bacterium]|nr:hypothetical protein [Bacteroidota bacterium]MBU2584895.1 hypothetical protein [Bacteroidota bacterium]
MSRNVYLLKLRLRSENLANSANELILLVHYNIPPFTLQSTIRFNNIVKEFMINRHNNLNRASEYAG